MLYEVITVAVYLRENEDVVEDVTEVAGVGHPGWGASAAFADLGVGLLRVVKTFRSAGR